MKIAKALHAHRTACWSSPRYRSSLQEPRSQRSIEIHDVQPIIRCGSRFRRPGAAWRLREPERSQGG
jgi:hypothetical protein